VSRPSVLVTVGTDHHRFDRLVHWCDAWARRHPEVEVFVQHGTAVAPTVAAGSAYVDPAELEARRGEATVVVTHGGLSSIMEARAAGFLPVVVARDPAAGEHVDDHQQRFTAHEAALGRIRLVADEDDLATVLAEALADPGRVRLAEGSSSVRDVVESVAALVDDLVARRPPRHRRHRRGRTRPRSAQETR
jgi:UDP-N-acetylglucosamine transferase subunit ALG13